jgi:hypothetical protein
MPDDGDVEGQGDRQVSVIHCQTPLTGVDDGGRILRFTMGQLYNGRYAVLVEVKEP